MNELKTWTSLATAIQMSLQTLGPLHLYTSARHKGGVLSCSKCALHCTRNLRVNWRRKCKSLCILIDETLQQKFQDRISSNMELQLQSCLDHYNRKDVCNTVIDTNNAFLNPYFSQKKTSDCHQHLNSRNLSGSWWIQYLCWILRSLSSWCHQLVSPKHWVRLYNRTIKPNTEGSTLVDVDCSTLCQFGLATS